MAGQHYTRVIAICLACLVFAGCASVPKPHPQASPPAVFGAIPDGDLFTRHAPLIAPENTHLDYNRPGRAASATRCG